MNTKTTSKQPDGSRWIDRQQLNRSLPEVVVCARSRAGYTPETDQLLECDKDKIDEDSVEYSAYLRMAEHAQALERRLNVTPTEKEGCARLLEEAEYEIFDVVDDGHPVVIELHPGHNGRSSYLFWRPLKDHDEAQLWEFVHDSPGQEIRNVSFLGEPAKALRKFITENAGGMARELAAQDSESPPT